MREYLQLVAQRWYPDAAAAAAAPADAARTNGRDGLRPSPASAAAAPPPPRIDAAAQEAALLLLHRYNYDPVKVRHAPLVARPLRGRAAPPRQSEYMAASKRGCSDTDCQRDGGGQPGHHLRWARGLDAAQEATTTQIAPQNSNGSAAAHHLTRRVLLHWILAVQSRV